MLLHIGKVKIRQKAAIEKITGERWDSFHPSAVKAYFAFTARGEHTPLLDRVWHSQNPDNKFNEVEQNLWDLMQAHTFHPATVEMWKEDFKKGLLFLDDFLGYPAPYIKHAFEVYKSVFGFIPTKYNKIVIR